MTDSFVEGRKSKLIRLKVKISNCYHKKTWKNLRKTRKTGKFPGEKPRKPNTSFQNKKSIRKMMKINKGQSLINLKSYL